MFEGYRKVNHIELIDMGLTLHPEEWGDAMTLYDWCDYSSYRHFNINGGDLTKLLEVLGLEFHPYHEKVYNPKEGKTITRRYTPDNLEFNIYDVPPESYTKNIKEIWAKIESANLLELLIVYNWDDGSEEAYPITYSGSFAVHWLEQVNKDDDG